MRFAEGMRGVVVVAVLAAQLAWAQDEKSATEKSAAEKSATEKSAAEKSAAEKSAAEKSAAEKSAAEKSAADKGTAEKGAAEKGGASDQDAEEQAKKLAKASQNPIASLISVPFQFNMAGGLGTNNRSLFLLNFQPVIPIKIKGRFSLIARLILPFVGAPDTSSTTGSTWGLGDFNPQIYLAAELPHDFTVGLGPTIVIPTATDSALGSGKLSIGPSVVGVWTGGPFVVGALINNAWSQGGGSAFYAQPFINVNLPHHTFLVTAPEITGSWKTGTWTLPVGGGAGAIIKMGLPTNINLQVYWNAVAPTGGPTWLVKMQLSFLFPAGKG